MGQWILRWTATLLVIAGSALLAWCALFVIDAWLAQRAARDSLAAASRTTVTVPSATERPTGDSLEATRLSRGSAVADLSIPRVHLSAVVLHGSDARTLRRGPGHLENTALPGEKGNVVIAGHRDTFFGPLKDVRAGDDVFADTPRGRFHYRVTSVRVVKPRDVSVLAPTRDATLTLITCYPFWVLGPAPDRLIVRAVGVDAMSASFVPVPQRPREPLPPPVAAPYARGAVGGDEALVREAIERFRRTYNARLASRRDAVPGEPLTFRSCDVSVSGTQASATCGSIASPGDGEPQTWSLTLEHADAGWAIRSIVHR